MGLRFAGCVGCVVALIATNAVAKTIALMGRDAQIPPITQDVRALHLREVGANRVYALHLPKHLVDLNLSANGLMVLPEGLVPSGIKRLWLADNRLLSMPSAMETWEQLTYLNLDCNLFKSLPNLSKTSLRWVRLNGNHLTEVPLLPDSVERLYLANNKLTAFTTKPKALRHLTLANNPLKEIPADLGCGLEELDLSGTQVTALPEELDDWRTLRVLNLAHCPLSDAEKDRLEAFFDPLKTLLIF